MTIFISTLEKTQHDEGTYSGGEWSSGFQVSWEGPWTR